MPHKQARHTTAPERKSSDHQKNPLPAGAMHIWTLPKIFHTLKEAHVLIDRDHVTTHRVAPRLIQIEFLIGTAQYPFFLSVTRQAAFLFWRRILRQTSLAWAAPETGPANNLYQASGRRPARATWADTTRIGRS